MNQTASMTQTSSMSTLDNGILLEAGTNEAEVLVFRVRGRRFGVNVAKVREVLPIERVTEIPRSHPAVDGLVEIRETVVPLVDLDCYLYGNTADAQPCRAVAAGEGNGGDVCGTLILLEFNAQLIAFRVQQIERIFRVSWKDTLPAPKLGDESSPITSVLRQQEGLVPLLDFESICASTGIGSAASSLDNVPKVECLTRAQMPIVFADDSQLISEMVKDALMEAGYTNLKGFADGQEAWDYLSELANESDPQQFANRVACIITDIEMPRMDGLSLTKQVREHPVTAATPVVVFSSIASRDNAKKGKQVGASAQVAKPKYDDLLRTVDHLLAQTA